MFWLKFPKNLLAKTSGTAHLTKLQRWLRYIAFKIKINKISRKNLELFEVGCS